jgi:hypothetical protein
MANIVLGVLGAGVGAVFGNPMLGFSLGMAVGGVLFPPKLPDQSRGKLDDLRVTGSGWGVAIPRCWGRVRLGGNVIWMAHYKDGIAVPSNTPGAVNLLEHVSDTHEGGKGGGGVTVHNYSYTTSIQVLVCEGPVSAITKIWADSDLVIYDSAQDPPSKYDLRIALGTDDQLPDSYVESIEGAGNVPAYRGFCVVTIQDMDLTDFGNRLPNLNFEVDRGVALVKDPLEALARACGMTRDDYDFSQANAPLEGLVLAQREAASQSLEPLCEIFALDFTESDGKLRVLPRGGAPVMTLDADDLGAIDWPPHDDDEPAPTLETTLGQDLELPRTMTLTYFSRQGNYQQASQQAIRATKGDIQQEETYNTPLVMSDDAARQAAERRLYQRWLERDTYKFSLDWRYLVLLPGSPVNLPVNGLHRVRIVRMDLALPGVIQFEAVPADDEGGVYCQVVSGGSTAQTAPVVQSVHPVTFTAWSGTELQDADGASPGFYVVGTWAEGGSGGQIYYSPDGGANYVLAGSVRERSVFGTTTSALADGATADAWDTTHSVGVALTERGSLQSAAQAEVENTATNAVLIGREIAGFASATPTGALFYTLSTLLRGRRGSLMTGHGIGEPFVLLSRAVQRVSVAESLIGQTVYVKVVAPGLTLSEVAPVAVIIAANHPPYATTDTLSGTVYTHGLVPLSNGDPAEPSVLFDAGAVILIEV